MSPLTESAPLRFAQGYTRPDDPDAVAYIAAVEAADGQALETATRMAINSFVKGCKADGIWPAIKASCILAGARTLNGALVPLRGTAPTNFNFVAGDYNRKTGLVGNGSTKYLDTNRASNADPQDSFHLAGYVSTSYTTGYLFGSNTGVSSRNEIEVSGGGPYNILLMARAILSPSIGGLSGINNFLGLSRSASNNSTIRVNGSSSTRSTASITPTPDTINVFRRYNPIGYLGASTRLVYYSVGESLDLALLDARVTALINAFAAAIP